MDARFAMRRNGAKAGSVVGPSHADKTKGRSRGRSDSDRPLYVSCANTRDQIWRSADAQVMRAEGKYGAVYGRCSWKSRRRINPLPFHERRNRLPRVAGWQRLSGAKSPRVLRLPRRLPRNLILAASDPQRSSLVIPPADLLAAVVSAPTGS